GNGSILQIRPVPYRGVCRSLHQSCKSFACSRIAADIQIEQIKRAAEAFDLQLCRLDLGLSEIIEHARTDQTHDQTDDRDDDQHLDQGEPTFTVHARYSSSRRVVAHHESQCPVPLFGRTHHRSCRSYNV